MAQSLAEKVAIHLKGKGYQSYNDIAHALDESSTRIATVVNQMRQSKKYELQIINKSNRKHAKLISFDEDGISASEDKLWRLAIFGEKYEG